jgi:hypothetical protein
MDAASRDLSCGRRGVNSDSVGVGEPRPREWESAPLQSPLRAGPQGAGNTWQATAEDLNFDNEGDD